MSRSFTESVTTAYHKDRIKESQIAEASVSKVLRLFGYANGTDARYICCLGTEPRVDIHKFMMGNQNLLMCIITHADRKVIDSALWKISSRLWNRLSKYEFGDSKTIEEIDSILRRNASNECECLMRYNP